MPLPEPPVRDPNVEVYDAVLPARLAWVVGLLAGALLGAVISIAVDSSSSAQLKARGVVIIVVIGAGVGLILGRLTVGTFERKRS